MSRPRVFISFSGQDRELVRRLFARMEAQQVALWNYADELQEIPGAERIDDHLRGRIDNSDYFLPCVTPASFASRYTALEVAYATGAGRSRPRILPIVTPECRSRAWPSPFSALADLRSREIDLESPAGIEATIEDLCRDMGVRYLPLLASDPRLPFLPRFQEEVAHKCSRYPEKDRAVYGRLMRISNDFDGLYRAGDYRRALAQISFFVLMCEHEFPNERFYYPHVVKGVCEISCGQLERATETLEALLNHTALDENVYGALGYVKQHQGLFRRALECYREAARRDPDDPAAQAGIVMNLLLCGEPVDVDCAFEKLDQARQCLPEDRAKILSLKAFALWQAGRHEEAEKTFETLVGRGCFNAAVLVDFARVLAERRKYASAIRLLTRFGADRQDEAVDHLLASLHAYAGDFRSSIGRFEALVGRCPCNRQYRVDFAQVLWRSGSRAQAREVCAPLVVPGGFPLPETAEDFFFDGLANWLHGRRERAEYDFERSGMPGEKHYRHLLP